VDFPGLIKILGENLYANPRACVRELIQNGNDSCVRRQTSDTTFQPTIRITSQPDERTLTFDDNGAGMLHEDVVRYLASIGGGRTRIERTRLSTEDKHAANMLIGQFGIGFLSSFVVADRVLVDTLSVEIEGGNAIRWICEGTAEYQIGQSDRTTPGTRVVLSLKPSHYDLLDDQVLLETIIYYADFIGFPIYLNDHAEPVNRMQAPWHTDSTYNDYAAYIQHRYGVAPLALEPIATERDDLSVQGVLFIPPRSGDWKRHLRSIDLFQKRMFIGEDLHILPEWAGFISGVIDCPTLDLVASRESAISDRPSYKALTSALGEAVSSFIQRLAAKERSTFLEVIQQHEWAVKWGAVRNDFFFDQVKDLLPISSDMGNLTLPRYLQRTPERLGGIKTIYYIPGQQMPAQQQSSLFRARGVPIFRADVVDEQFLKKYVERQHNVNLRQVVSGVVEMMNFAEGDQWRTLETRYKQMGIPARGVRFHPPDMPALAVRRSDHDQDQMIGQVIDGSRGLADFIGQVGKETSDAYELCFNVDNPLIQRLAHYRGSAAVLEASLRSIHSSALLAAGVELTQELGQAVAQSEMHIIEMLLEQDTLLQGKTPAARTSITPDPPANTIPQRHTKGGIAPAPPDLGGPPLGQDIKPPVSDPSKIVPTVHAAPPPMPFASPTTQQVAHPAPQQRQPDRSTAPPPAAAEDVPDPYRRPFQSTHQERWKPTHTYAEPMRQEDRPFRDPEYSGSRRTANAPVSSSVSGGTSGESNTEGDDPLVVRLMKKFLG
jgi:molecular chaperone HtpG